jgi:Na+-transporting methylmalonyl-CoA/oxaloacetate decarboxylase gamma subunit
MTNMEYRTAYTNFYSSMINVPFFGTHYNTIMPLFIIVFGLVFALLTLLKCKNRAMSALQTYNKRGDASTTVSDKDKKKPNDKEMTIVEQILLGERAILSEFDQAKKKEERNRLLRFNNVVDTT